jgi:hypothetical protein
MTSKAIEVRLGHGTWVRLHRSVYVDRRCNLRRWPWRNTVDETLST